MNGSRRLTVPVLDALRGREGCHFTRDELKAFYAQQYVRLNPSLDEVDTPEKARRLLACCREAGLVRADRVLEVGCGGGALLALVRDGLGARLAVGLDYGPEQASLAAQRGLSAIACGDAAALPFAPHSFDLAFLADVLEHVLDPLAVLREMARVARRVAVLVPAERGAIADLIYASRRFRGKPTNLEQYGHIWRWDAQQVTRLVKDGGLAPLRVLVFDPEHPARPATLRGRLVSAVEAMVARLGRDVARRAFGGMAVVVVAQRSPGGA